MPSIFLSNLNMLSVNTFDNFIAYLPRQLVIPQKPHTEWLLYIFLQTYISGTAEMYVWLISKDLMINPTKRAAVYFSFNRFRQSSQCVRTVHRRRSTVKHRSLLASQETVFRVKSSSDAKISLLSVPSNLKALSYEVVIGAVNSIKTAAYSFLNRWPSVRSRYAGHTGSGRAATVLGELDQRNNSVWKRKRRRSTPVDKFSWSKADAEKALAFDRYGIRRWGKLQTPTNRWMVVWRPIWYDRLCTF